MDDKRKAELLTACISDLSFISVRGRDDCMRMCSVIDALKAVRNSIITESEAVTEAAYDKNTDAEG